MAALLFPNPAALRLALASGVVPDQFARAPARGEIDQHGHIWIELAELPPRQVLAPLSRFGIQALGKAGIATHAIGSWAELLPLISRTAEAARGAVLFLVPDNRLARFAARLQRQSRERLGIALGELNGQPTSLVVHNSPPPAILGETAEPTSPIEAFTQEADAIWVRWGWSHPQPAHLVAPPGHILLLRPPHRVSAERLTVPAPQEEEFVLRFPAQSPEASPRHAPPIVIQPYLARRVAAEKESVWVLNAAQVAEFWAFCASTDERLIRRLEIASIVRDGEARLVLRTSGKRPPLSFPFPAMGYAHDPRVPGLLVPADRELRPPLRLRELTSRLGLHPTRIVWLEPELGGGVTPHALPLAALRPVRELIEFPTPASRQLTPVARADPFPLPKGLMVPSETGPTVSSSGLAAPLPSIEEFEETKAESPAPPGWFRRALRKFMSGTRARRERPAPATEGAEPSAAQEGPARVERKVPSPAALLHGRDWGARRSDLETRLFREIPSLGPAGRAQRWADLAALYGTMGNAADAAVCWMNAAWESPVPNLLYLNEWFLAECRAAKITGPSNTLEAWLGGSGRPGAIRVVVAYTAWAGYCSTPPSEFPGALPRILTRLGEHFDELPIRATWLARLAATQLCDGDVLGLARWHDRVLTRLAERGPGLDLDEPSFLRFHGTASADRFQTAREWLVRMLEPALSWIQRHSDGGRLRSSGLDAEIEATASYAQFMLAWGLGCLGERTRSRDWAAWARKKLLRASSTAVDQAGHLVLADLFSHRIKDAQEGRPPKLGLPSELRKRIDALGSFTRYPVDRLRERSRILEPLDRIHAYRGLDHKLFWGNDQLAERLFVLFERSDPTTLGAEAEALIRLCTDFPTTTTVPRIVFTLLEVAPWLDTVTFLRVLEIVPTAIEWTEPWLFSGRGPEADRAARLVRYQAQMIDAAYGTASALPPDIAAPAIARLTRRLVAGGAEMRRPFLAAAVTVFRCLRRQRLASEADLLIHYLDPAPAAAGSDSMLAPMTRLGLGVGYFTAGDEDAGTRILNEARETLFLTENGDIRERTELAIAYASALGFAPARIAYGRLEELFQRPRFVVEVKSSTNRYFTLKPLQLIDTVVRSVVTDEFALGSAVRSWLDDDEYLIRSRVHRDLSQVMREAGLE